MFALWPQGTATWATERGCTGRGGSLAVQRGSGAVLGTSEVKWPHGFQTTKCWLSSVFSWSPVWKSETELSPVHGIGDGQECRPSEV